MKRLKSTRFRIGAAVAATVVLAACAGEGKEVSPSGETAIGQASPAPTRRPSSTPTPVPDNRSLVAEAIQRLSATRPHGLTLVTTVKGDVTSKTTQQFSFDGPDRMILREETDRIFEVIANGQQLYVREPGGDWRIPTGVSADSYAAISKLYDLSGTIPQRESRESYVGTEKVQLVSFVAGLDTVVQAAERVVADNPSLKSNLTQTRLSSIKMDYYILPKDGLIKRAVLTVDAMFNDKPVQTVVDFLYTYNAPFLFPDDSPLKGR